MVFDKMKNKLWMGQEIEGMHKGDLTLFISGDDITYSEITKVLDSHINIVQLYFGAGGCTVVNYDLLRMCLKYHNELRMTIELYPIDLHLFEEFMDKVSFMFTVNIHNLDRLKDRFDMHQLKLQSLEDNSSKVIMIDNLNNFDMVDAELLLQDKTYEGDVVLK